MNATLESVRLLVSSPAHYSTRLARNTVDVRAAQALRYQVFNLELSEGLEQSHLTGLDEDRFDFVCDHLIVEHLSTGQIVGTYRLQSGHNAVSYFGYYCAQEFEFDVFDPFRAEMVELGRACVHRQHRNLVVLGLLWKGIADYARLHGARYLFGCSSITSQDPAVGASAYADLCRKHLAEPQMAHASPSGLRLFSRPACRRSCGHPKTAPRLPDSRRENLRPARARPTI